MSGIGDTEWDDELLADRVNVLASARNQDKTGVSRPSPTPTQTDVPCLFIHSGGQPQVTELADLAQDQVAVGFAEDVGLTNGDVLLPRPPSIGPKIRIGSYRFLTPIGLYVAIGTQVR